MMADSAFSKGPEGNQNTIGDIRKEPSVNALANSRERGAGGQQLVCEVSTDTLNLQAKQMIQKET